jgi:hypothetical protein
MPITNKSEFQVHSLAAAKRIRRARQRAQTIEIIVPEKHVWQEALSRAQGDPMRLQTVAPNSVIVWNSPAQRAELMETQWPR